MTTLLVISDLHLCDGDPITECWTDRQQAAFELFLASTHEGGELADDQVELIINGDCFDFLLSKPALTSQATTDVNVAHAKWANIAAAHGSWFTAIRDFLRTPGHRVTFLIGNHDLELFYPSIRSRVRSAINAAPGMVRFCLNRGYRPLPDVFIEHGMQFDAYNALPDAWKTGELAGIARDLETSDQRSKPVGPLALPWGSRYFYQVFIPFKLRYPFIDAMVPLLTAPRYLALLCVLDPDLLIATLDRLGGLLPQAHELVPQVPPEARANPLALYIGLLPVMQAFANVVNGPGEGSDANQNNEVLTLIAALQQEDHDTALRMIFSRANVLPPLLPTPTLVTSLPEIRFAITGHTHEEGRWLLAPDKTALNTGTWCRRFGRPTESTWNNRYGQWAAQAALERYPGADATRFTVAWIRADADALTSSVELIAWQGDSYQLVPDHAFA